MIILNETEWAHDMLDKKSLGDSPYDTLRRVARYYLDQQYKKSDVRRKLDFFILQCDPSASLPKWSDTADKALNRAVKRPAVEIDCIVVTKPEMDIIDGLSGTQTRRLAFTLLCLAKYLDIVNPGGDHWVTTEDNEIMKMANINTSLKRQSAMFRKLNECGLIRFSRKVDNTNVRVCFMQDGEDAVRIYDYRNLGYQYMLYHGGSFFECSNCGIVTKENNPQTGRKQKYCKACAAKIAAVQHVNAVMKMRNSENKTC